MTSGFYGPEDFGSSPFDDFLARIYGAGGARRPGHRVDITRLMSAPARELLGAAASHVAERGGANLDTEQLLWTAAYLAAVDWVAQHGYQPEFGARPMRRVIQREVGSELSRRLLDAQINPGQQVTVDVQDGRLTFIPHEQQVPAHAS